MSSAELSRVIYRSILRWSKLAEGVPFTLRAADVAECLPVVPIESFESLEDSQAVRSLTKTGFRAFSGLEDESEVSVLLDNGLRGLRLLNTYYKQQIEELRSERSLHHQRENVAFSVGQVFQHKKYGYRAVIYGWDPLCARETAWADALKLEHNQPFYKALPDEDDCQRVFGSIRITKYVAQENVMPVNVPRRVTHRALEEYFAAYSSSTMRYVPKRQLQYTYPDDYHAEDAVSCRGDTNILQLSSDEEKDMSTLKSQLPGLLRD